MNKQSCILPAMAILALLLLPACRSPQAARPTPTPPSTVPAGPDATGSPIPTTPRTTTTSPPATVTTALPATATVRPPTSVPPPSATPAPVVQSAFVRQWCPHLSPPLGLFALADPVIDRDADPETVYAGYQIAELRPESAADPCLLYLAPGPLGAPQLGGPHLFWQSFDDAAGGITIWQHAALPERPPRTFLPHTPLLATTSGTTREKAGLADFVISTAGDFLAWSFTDPRVNEDNELGFVQTINALSPGEPLDQRPIIELLFDVVPETDGRARIIRLHHVSAETGRLYYSEEPIGLGRNWPDPAGQYSTLNSLATRVAAAPALHYDCGRDYWCISDFAPALDLLVVMQNDPPAVAVRRLSDGALLSTLRVPDTYTYLRQARIGPDGSIAFMGVALAGSIFDGPPSDVAVFVSPPPYTGDPERVLSDSGLQNLLGWTAPAGLLANGTPPEATPSAAIPLPSRLMLLDTATGNGEWLPLDAGGFISLVP